MSTSNNNYPITLAEFEAQALYAQSAGRAVESIRKMNLFHRTEEVREECYQAILEHLSQWVVREELEQYLHLTGNFRLPEWRNFRDDHFPVGIDFCLRIPGHTEISCTAQLQKRYGYSLEVLNCGHYFAAGNPHYLGEALVTARKDYLYKQQQEQSNQEYRRTVSQARVDPPREIREEEVEEIEIPF
jgi:hypothetical protein